MGRSPCCTKVGLNRGAWTASEDKILTDYIHLNGEGKWRNLPKKAGLQRCGKSCRLRWLNYLRPDIKRGNITKDEEDLIIRLHKLLGNRWSLIAGRLPGRTDNEIKNYWNTTLGKKLCVPKPATQSNETSKRKTGTTESTHKDHSKVVRTKAVRCSKTIFNPHPQRINPIEPNTRAGRSDIVEVQNPVAKPAPSGLQTGVSPFHSEEENSSNFMLDIDMDKTISLSDLFTPDFTGLDFSDHIINADHISPSSSDGTQLFSKEMWDYFSCTPEFGEDWLTSNF